MARPGGRTIVLDRLPILLAIAALASAQTFTQRGFFEADASIFPQTASNDSGRITGEALFRYEAFFKLYSWLRFAGGVDARTDTHNDIERTASLSWWDRERQRPAFGMRLLSAIFTRGKLTFEAGKQFIRWGKTDIVNPTDRFAPRDFLNVVNDDFLGVTATRLTYGGQSNAIDFVFSPRLTPSRMPILNQRWSALPSGVPIRELAPDFPGGPQLGARWNHIGRAAEYALSFYNGYDHLPLFGAQASASGIAVQRFYPQMRMYGGDAAVPLPLLTVKAEAAYFTSASPLADNYGLYVLQLERQSGEWFFVGGYAGQFIVRHGTAAGFSPVRGLTRSVVARAGYTIDVNRSVSFEAVVRQNGRGAWLKSEYSQAFGQHWRATAAVAWIGGDTEDFLGQFHRNSHASLALRYSF